MKKLKTEKKTDGQTYNRAKSDQDPVGYRHKTEPDFVGSGYHPPERFVPLLAKFSHPANVTHRTQLFNQLQRQYGNRYVQRVVSAYRSQNVEEDEDKLALEIISKKGSGRALELGNLTFQRLFKSGAIQAKLKIGQPNDIYEQEADRVADEVMRIPEPKVQLPKIPLASTFVQRNPDNEHIQIANTIGEYEGRPEFEYLSELPQGVAFYPGSDESCQEDYIYYDPNQTNDSNQTNDPNQTTAGRVRSLVRQEVIRRDRSEYVVRYPRYDLFIVLGPGALSNLPHSLLATLSHEIIHLRQTKAIRRFRLDIANTNRRALIDNDPSAIPVSIREANVRLRGVSRREAGVDVLNQADMELQAHATTFAHFFGIHIESARDQLVPLCFHHYEVTPEWSYDWASPDGREYALRVAVDTIMTGGNRATFDRDVLPYLEAVTTSPPLTATPSQPPSSETSPETGPEEGLEAGGQGDGRSRFLSDLVDHIRRRSSTGSTP